MLDPYLRATLHVGALIATRAVCQPSLRGYIPNPDNLQTLPTFKIRTTLVKMKQAPPQIILVMGITGVGKSTFIKYATGSDVKVGEGLSSCECCCL